MTIFNKGGTVTPKSILNVVPIGRYYATDRFRPGMELEVIQSTTSKVRVKSGSRHFWFDKTDVEPWVDPSSRAQKQNEVFKNEGDIEINDPRIAWIWKRAAEIADEREFCEEYDTIAQDLGIPGRPKDWTVIFRLDPDNEEYTATVVVNAQGEDEAIAEARALFTSSSFELVTVAEYEGW